MATYFFDIDGTIVNFHTHEWLPGAKEKLFQIAQEGHDIVFITMRGPQDEGQPWSVQNTVKLLEELPFRYRLLTDCVSPRIIVDDSKPTAIHWPHNGSYEEHGDLLEKKK
jgi:hypothetical protein